MECHNHADCPHDHEGAACLLGGDDVDTLSDAPEETSVEVAEVLAEAAVEIAEIEAAVEEHAIDAAIEHHEIEAETEQAQIDAGLEHHHIEADAEEEIEELEEVVEELVDELADVIEEPMVDDELREADEMMDEGEPVAVAPPARVVAPSEPKKARSQSRFTARHSR